MDTFTYVSTIFKTYKFFFQYNKEELFLVEMTFTFMSGTLNVKIPNDIGYGDEIPFPVVIHFGCTLHST